MKASRYNVTSHNPGTDETVLFNTLYGSTAVIERDNLDVVLGLLKDPAVVNTDQQRLLVDILEQGKFVIPDEIDELAIVRRRKQCGVSDKNRAEIIIMPNMDCNFACPYCYEKHDHNKRMTTEVEASINKWLTNILGEYKVVLLNWFGGEPLLSSDVVLRITNHVREICREKEVSLLTHMTTNGYGFTESAMEELLACGIRNYQITVDGPESVHNKTRILKNGRGSFSRVKDNIIRLAILDAGTKISLRVNYNHVNIDVIPELLEQFPASIRPQLRVVFEPIFGDERVSATSNMPAERISKTIAHCYDLAKQLGYDIVHGGLGVGKLVYCYAEREEQYILNHTGEVFKCSVSEFSSENRVGYIDPAGKLIIDKNQWEAWFGIDPFEKTCETCLFLPLCMGGCRKDRLANKKTGSYCHLIPTNTSHALKSIAFGDFSSVLHDHAKISRSCAINRQSEV